MQFFPAAFADMPIKCGFSENPRLEQRSFEQDFSQVLSQEESVVRPASAPPIERSDAASSTPAPVEKCEDEPSARETSESDQESALAQQDNLQEEKFSGPRDSDSEEAVSEKSIGEQDKDGAFENQHTAYAQVLRQIEQFVLHLEEKEGGGNSADLEKKIGKFLNDLGKEQPFLAENVDMDALKKDLARLVQNLKAGRLEYKELAQQVSTALGRSASGELARFFDKEGKTGKDSAAEKPSLNSVPRQNAEKTEQVVFETHSELKGKEESGAQNGALRQESGRSAREHALKAEDSAAQKDENSAMKAEFLSKKSEKNGQPELLSTKTDLKMDQSEYGSLVKSGHESVSVSTLANAQTREHKAEVYRQVENGIFKNLGQGRKQLVLRLDPPKLGQVSVILQVRGKEVQAVLRSSTQEASQALQEQLGQLRTQLEAQGLKVAKLEVQTQLADGQTQSQWQGAEQHNRSQQEREQRFSGRVFSSFQRHGAELAREMQSVPQPEYSSANGLDLFA